MYDGIATVQKFQVVIIIIFLFYFILFKLHFNIFVGRSLFVTSRDYILRV